MDVSVGITGAGPAGLLIANALARAGIDCAVFERLSETDVRARARAGLIENRTVSVLDRHGLAHGLRSRGSTNGACEFRRGGKRHVFDYAALTGVEHYVYPQQLLVADLIDALRAVGGVINFSCPVKEVRMAQRPAIVLMDGSGVQCDFVLGCDGFHGVTLSSASSFSCDGVDFGAEMLTLLAEAPPSSDHTVYGLHPGGFAGHFPRSATISRFYLQVEPGTNAQSWTDDRIWDVLEERLAADGVDVVRGRILERGTLELRSYVTEPMQEGPVFLAGDSAHIVTPAGGKGMNLALQDADELVAGLLNHYRRGDDRRLTAYTATRLPAVWRAVEFSHWMLDTMVALPGAGRFREGLREARLARLLSGGHFARDFAANYVGLAAA